MTSYVTGGAIRALREKKGCTQRELAGEIGVTDKAVSRWETGKGLPDTAVLKELSEALGVSVGELLAGERLEKLEGAMDAIRAKYGRGAIAPASVPRDPGEDRHAPPPGGTRSYLEE